jgi:hypothetical protein
MNIPRVGNTNPNVGRHRNQEPIPEEIIPSCNGFDCEIDSAVNENRPADQEKLRAELYAELSDKVPAPLPENPADRAAAIASYGDIVGKEEFQFRMMHRLLARQVPMTSIANVMGLSVRQTYRIHKKLKERYVSNASGVDFMEYVGETIWAYEDWIASALRFNSDTNSPLRDRMKALRLANEIKSSQIRFLRLVGFFEHGKISPPEKNQNRDQEKVDETLKMLAELVNSSLEALSSKNFSS